VTGDQVGEIRVATVHIPESLAIAAARYTAERWVERNGKGVADLHLYHLDDCDRMTAMCPPEPHDHIGWRGLIVD
jgi:hypothetical protein